MQTSKNTMQPSSPAPHRAAQQRSLVAVLALAAVLACLPHSAQAFSFDDLEKVEKVERGERKVREAARREEEARRQAQQQADDAARQRAASSGDSSSGGSSSSSSGTGGRYSVYNDKGTAASWAWFKREIVVKCEGGRKGGEMPSVYLESSGRWSTTYVGGKFDTFQATATAACS